MKQAQEFILQGLNIGIYKEEQRKQFINALNRKYKIE